MKKSYFVLSAIVCFTFVVFGAYFLATLSPSSVSAQQPERPGMMMRPMGMDNVSMVMDDTHLYIANSTTVYKIKKSDLQIEKTVEFNKRPVPPSKKPMKNKNWEEEDD